MNVSLKDLYGEIIALDPFTKDRVSTLRIKNKVKWRRAYINSERGRKGLIEEVEEPYLSEILKKWGDTPTIEEKENIILPEIREMYEERIVVYIDLLGFKNAIEKKYPSYVLFAFLNNMQYFKDDYCKRFHFESIELTVLSDSIIFSIPAKKEDALSSILNCMLHTAYPHTAEYLPIRGGIAIGEIYHKDNIIFGPALVSAYEIEKEYAIYPRIVALPNTLEALSRLSFDNNEIVESYFCLDHDGVLYLDILSFSICPYSNDKHQIDSLLSSLQLSSQFGLRTAPDAHVREKYLWLYKYHYNWVSANRVNANRANANRSIFLNSFLEEDQKLELWDNEMERILINESKGPIYDYRYIIFALILDENNRIGILNNELISSGQPLKSNSAKELETKVNKYVEIDESKGYFTCFTPSIYCFYSKFEKRHIHERADWYLYYAEHKKDDALKWLSLKECKGIIPDYQYNYISNERGFLNIISEQEHSFN